MATLRELAAAAHTAAEAKAAADRAAAEQMAKAALVVKARAAMVPVLTDPLTAKLALDPKDDKTVVAEQVLLTPATVVLRTAEVDEAARTFFAVAGDVVRLTWRQDGAWREGPLVRNLAEVGAAQDELTS